MDKSSFLASILGQINGYRRRINKGLLAIRLLRSISLALCCGLLWAWVKPEAWGQQLFLIGLSFLVFTVMDWQKGLRPSEMSDWLMTLEINHPQLESSAFELKDQTVLDSGWRDTINREWLRHRQEGRRLLLMRASTLLLPLLCLLVLSQTAAQAWTNTLDTLERAAMSLSYGARLRVVEGATDANLGVVTLSRSTAKLTVLEQNLIEIQVRTAPEAAPSLTIKDRQDKVLQSFRLLKAAAEDGTESKDQFAVSFAVTEDAQVFLSTLSSSSPAAVITVKHLPVPKVSLSSPAGDNTWADDKPLPVDITVKAEHPLQNVQLLIKSGERIHRELVKDVLAQDKFELTTDYTLALETYMESDQQELEIVAEATDRAPSGALVGRSKPLIIKVASAYGRYQQTLRMLAEVKQELDRGVENPEKFNVKAALELAKKASIQSEDSPYFDGLDRPQIMLFQQAFETLAKEKNLEMMTSVSEDLNRFLFEHETLDDRERDRDFFVAARTLSRIVEQNKSERLVSIDKVMARLTTFLNERHERWVMRVGRLEANFKPEAWPKVEKKPFHETMQEIASMDRQKPAQTEAALQKLSQSAEAYRQWIEALEAQEDAARAAQTKQRQQGLANAQNQLRELQKRQAQVSGKLDKAGQRQADDLKNSWASVRMDQNSNISGTRELEGQLRSLSPTAGVRMKAALEAMEMTVEEGNGERFTNAESGSDMAGRLLQQAESAAQQAQRDSGRRGRRRRVTNDQYHGQQVAGGDVDLKRDYKVNRRYREDVLEDIRQLKKEDVSEETDHLLEDYLRKVIR